MASQSAAWVHSTQTPASPPTASLRLAALAQQGATQSLFPGTLPSPSSCVLNLSLTTSDKCTPRGERQPSCLRPMAAMAGVGSGFPLVRQL